MLDNLRSGHKTNNVYELCTLLYKSGLEQSLTLISSQKGDTVLGSSDPEVTNRSYSAVILLLMNADRITKLSKPEDKPVHPTQIRWWKMGDTVHDRNAHGGLSTDWLDYVVSLLVPLSLSGFSAAQSDPTLAALQWFDEESPLQLFESPPSDFELQFTVTTHELRQRRLTMKQSKFYDRSVQPLPLAAIARNARGRSL
jgi:hypothetical protein